MPEHILVAEALTLTEGVTDGFTVMAIPLEVAVEELTQLWLEVITQVIVFPLVNELELKVALLVPAFTPFTFH